MRLIQYILICFLGLGLCANAQTKNPDNTLLWEISGNSLTKPSYIFGTYHFADKGFVDTMKVVNEKLAAADMVVGELIINKEMAVKLMPYMILKNNSLDKILSPTEYKMVDDYLSTLGQYKLKMFNMFSPMALQAFIIQMTAPKTFTDTNPAIDQYFQDYGNANNKEVIGLETIEEQGQILFGSSIERQKQMLVNYVKEEKKNKIASEKLYKDYISQNLKATEKTFTKLDGFTPEEADRLLKNRNIKWIEKLPTLMQNKSLFIAVGAGHLVGKDGLIKRLRAQGYTVKPVSTN
ncbi:TraB/GumN family protein [Pedobacter polaris]|uniref:TraB/GumN family protein n=1 Tax=Pedobacter polaris TaxID=2571273 RepID=A0A4V5P0K8_9SPHI|nr:TraB/GumN family protein [Pedobacter polaris]TKC12342.1 TraB/GumN family protein [Pedobacter polaris]